MTTYSLIAMGAVVAMVVARAALRDRDPTLTDFVTVLQERSRDLKPGGKVEVLLPSLAQDELIVLIENLYATSVPNDGGLSGRAMRTMFDATVEEGAGSTILYLVYKGDIRGSERVSKCNLTIGAFNNGVIIRPASRTAHLECAPVLIPSRPNECREVSLWNDKCAAKLVLQ